MRNPDRLWMDLAARFADQSRCRSRKVGAILVDGHSHLFGQGWNSAPPCSSTDQCIRCSVSVPSGKDLNLAICTHAEANAIANAARAGRTTEGATLYCTTFPCSECAKLIVTAGIVEVVYDQTYDSPLSSQILLVGKVKIRRCQNESVG